MKLLLVIHSMESGGAERVASLLGNHWITRGWEVCIVTLTSSESDFYPLNAGIRRIGLKLDNDSRNVLEAALMTIRRCLALRKTIKQERPDLILGMMTATNCLIALAGVALKIPKIGAERCAGPELKNRDISFTIR